MPLKRLRKKARQNKLNDSNELTEPIESSEPVESLEPVESTELIGHSIGTGIPKIKSLGDKTQSTDNKYKSLLKKKQSEAKWERNYA
jgi:hypothetical protein